MDEEVIERLKNLHEWVAPSYGLKIETIDAHAAGQPLRLILSGMPHLRGHSLLDRWRYARTHFDHLRRALIFEPRGHLDMYGCILTEPQRSDSHFGALFIHRGGFSPMCGHGVIALTTILLEAGIVDMRAPETRLKIDTPAGLVRCYGHIEDDRVRRVFFENVPSFVVHENEEVEVPELNTKVKFDSAYGGAFFAFVEAASINLSCIPENVAKIQAAGCAILQAINRQFAFKHPVDPDLGFLFGVVFIDKPVRRRTGMADSRHVCVFSEGCIDRSPTGMAICARLALMAARGKAAHGMNFTVEGILGNSFTGRIVAKTEEHGNPAWIVEVEGRAWITGRHTFFIDSEDPCLEGFLL
ncbi:MAG TPA: proline racemase family protein [Verrucomicrobiales bacterium]|jgi:trans-L-3-hydroxyproline dehydratase|nr:proline racemase family protein [Verrucomicrobiales bacterium]